jgi:hypothetical protein
MLEGRIGPGWDQLGARTSDEDLTVVLKRLKKRPLDYFKHSFYADTAVFGGAARRLASTIDRSCSPPTAVRPGKGTVHGKRWHPRRLDMPKADKEKILRNSKP